MSCFPHVYKIKSINEQIKKRSEMIIYSWSLDSTILNHKT